MDHKMDKLLAKRDKEYQGILDSVLKDIRVQLNDQLKCLDGRVETQLAIVAEIQDFFRKRAEVETEYSKSLDKLSRTLALRHKEQKQKREQWHLFSTYSCWKQLVEATRRESRDRAIVADIYNNNIINRLSQISDDVQRIYRKCREISFESHEELLKVLHELHTTMKTYHNYWAEFRTAESKLNLAENQKKKLEQSIPPEKLVKRKKFRLIEKDIEKRRGKYNDAKIKALKARNDYLLCMDAANAALHKYFVDDLSDIMDCMDLGFHHSMANALRVHMSAEECVRQSKQVSAEALNKCLEGLDSRLDKQKFLEHNNSAFMIPKKFEFLGQKGDDATQISTAAGVVEDLETRFAQLCRRLSQLKTESEEIWKTMETAEKTLMEMITVKDFSVSAYFFDAHAQLAANQPQPLTTSGSTSSILMFHSLTSQGTPSMSIQSQLQAASGNNKAQHEPITAKMRQDRHETEDFYLSKFRQYMLDSNLTTRLQAKYEDISKAVGPDLANRVRGGELPGGLKPPRRKRIGRPMITAGPAGAGGAHAGPKLFGGSLEEYLEASSEEIPVIIKSCVRVINLYGLHHQGIFRVSGSQVEINNFKDSFERGEDPLRDVTDASDINSVAGVLKLYLRELREPLFPTVYFDQLMDLAQLESKHEFVMRCKELVLALPRCVFIVMRYLFAFLNHLSEFSDENMMDSYNLAICFGPSLVPIPEDKDQVQFQNMVNELIKNVIIYHEDIFPTDGGIMYEKYLLPNAGDDTDVGEAPSESHIADDVDSEICHSEDEIVLRDKDNSLQLFTKSDVLQGLAQFDFTARSPRELSFKKGDTLALYSQVSSDWWRGAFKGRQGLIPDKYIVLKIEDDDKERSEPRSSIPFNDSMEDDSLPSSSSTDVKRRRSSSSDSGRPLPLSGKMGMPSPKVPGHKQTASVSILSTSPATPGSEAMGDVIHPLQRFASSDLQQTIPSMDYNRRSASIVSSSASCSLGGSVDSLSKLSDIDEPQTESVGSDSYGANDDDRAELTEDSKSDEFIDEEPTENEVILADENVKNNNLQDDEGIDEAKAATEAAVVALDSAMAEVLSAANKLAMSDDKDEVEVEPEKPTPRLQRGTPVVTQRDPRNLSRSAAPLEATNSGFTQRVQHRRNHSADAESTLSETNDSPSVRVEAYAKVKRESLENVSSNSNFRIRRSLWEERAAGSSGESTEGQSVKARDFWEQRSSIVPNKTAPDLVMDLPISSSPPSSSSSPGPSPVLDSPETSAADRFAESNQSTLKKNVSAAKRDMPQSTSDSSTSSSPSTSGVIELSRKSVSDMRAELESSALQPSPSPAIEKKKIPKFPLSFPLPQGSSTGGSPLPSPKVKPQVLKKPALPNQKPSPEPARKVVPRFFDSAQ